MNALSYESARSHTGRDRRERDVGRRGCSGDRAAPRRPISLAPLSIEAPRKATEDKLERVSRLCAYRDFVRANIGKHKGDIGRGRGVSGTEGRGDAIFYGYGQLLSIATKRFRA